MVVSTWLKIKPYLLKHPAVVNIKTGIIHREGCPLGKACTKNCVYIEEEKAFKMLGENSLMHYCKIEEIVLKNTNPDKYAEYCTECYEDRFSGGDCWVDYDCTTRETIYRFFEKNSIQDALELFN